MLGAGFFHQVIGRCPITVTVEQGANDPTAQHSGECFLICLWLEGRDDIFTWWYGPGIGCQGSRVLPTKSANGSPAFGQYKPSETGSGHDPWALQVIEVKDGKIVELTFFLGTETLFPLFGLPARLN